MPACQKAERDLSQEPAEARSAQAAHYDNAPRTSWTLRRADTVSSRAASPINFWDRIWVQMTERAAILLKLMLGGRVGKARQEPARPKRQEVLGPPETGGSVFLIWLLPSLLTLTSVSETHLGPCMIRAFFMGRGKAVWGLVILILTPKRMGYQLPE